MGMNIRSIFDMNIEVSRGGGMAIILRDPRKFDRSIKSGAYTQVYKTGSRNACIEHTRVSFFKKRPVTRTFDC